MIAKWREAGKIEIWTNAVDGMEDMLPLLDKFGLSITDFEKFIREGRTTVASARCSTRGCWRWRRPASPPRNRTPLIEGVASAHDSAAQAAQGAALVNKVFTMSQDDATAAVDNFLRNKDPISEFPDEFPRMARAMSNGTTRRRPTWNGSPKSWGSPLTRRCRSRPTTPTPCGMTRSRRCRQRNRLKRI